MTSVFLCAPVYRAMMPEAVTSMLRATALLEANGFRTTMPEFVVECPYAHMARTELLGRFLHSRCDIMWGIDDDMAFDADTVLAMCEALRDERADVIGAAYALRWGTRYAVEHLPGAIESKRFQSFSIPVHGSHDRVHRFIEVSAIGTGLFVASRRGIVRMIDACPEAIVGPKAEPIVALFDHTRKWTGEIWMPRGEDYSFCDYARKAGLKVYCCTTAKTTHFARFGYEANMDEQLVNGGATFDDSGLLPEGAEAESSPIRDTD